MNDRVPELAREWFDQMMFLDESNVKPKKRKKAHKALKHLRKELCGMLGLKKGCSDRKLLKALNRALKKSKKSAFCWQKMVEKSVPDLIRLLDHQLTLGKQLKYLPSSSNRSDSLHEIDV